jgi:DNA-binding transcriptional ArsR family regulator
MAVLSFCTISHTDLVIILAHPGGRKNQKDLCNQSVSNIFATERLRIKFTKMRRDVFQAIADPTRRALLSLIALQAMTPHVMAEHFNCSRQAISKHVKILTECELLKMEQHGRENYYHFNPNKMKEVDKFLEPFRALWEARFNQLDQILTNLKPRKKS